jgi:hypothetical protein
MGYGAEPVRLLRRAAPIRLAVPAAHLRGRAVAAGEARA